MPRRIPALLGSRFQQGSRRMEPDGALLQLHPHSQHPWFRAIYGPRRKGTDILPKYPCSCQELRSVRFTGLQADLRVSQRGSTTSTRSGPLKSFLAQPRRANPLHTCPAPFAKIFWFTFEPNHFYIHRHPAPTRGAYRDRHGRWARDAMDAGNVADESTDLRTAKSCGPDAPTLASSS